MLGAPAAAVRRAWCSRRHRVTGRRRRLLFFSSSISQPSAAAAMPRLPALACLALAAAAALVARPAWALNCSERGLAESRSVGANNNVTGCANTVVGARLAVGAAGRGGGRPAARIWGANASRRGTTKERVPALAPRPADARARAGSSDVVAGDGNKVYGSHEVVYGECAAAFATPAGELPPSGVWAQLAPDAARAAPPPATTSCGRATATSCAGRA